MNREIERRLAVLESQATPDVITITRHVTRMIDGKPLTVIITRRISAPAPRGTR